MGGISEATATRRMRAFDTLDEKVATHMRVMTDAVEAAERGDWQAFRLLVPVVNAARDDANHALRRYLIVSKNLNMEDD